MLKLKEVVRKIKKDAVSEDEISALSMLIVGQCIYFFNKPMVESFSGQKDFVSGNVKLIAGKIMKALAN